MRISEQVIQEIRQRVDIVQLVSRRVDLKKRGRNFVGLCPFHDEKTPSFNVSPERASYHCFGCHESGDAISFVQQTDGKTFPEAIRQLAGEVGIEVEAQQETPQERQERERRQQLAEVNAALLERYRALLQDRVGTAARAYLERRGVSAGQIDRFAIGFGGPGRSLQRCEVTDRFSSADLVASGAFAEGDRDPYHRFGERIVFPIRDREGKVLGFGGRVFGARDDGKSAKYVNSAEGPLFHKSRVLYGVHEARRDLARGTPAVMVEGYLDVIALDSVGITTAVAPCGTALTPSQANLLKRASKVATICFDGDDAGRTAARRAVPMLLSAGLEVRLAELPDGEDPDSLAHRAPEEAAALVRRAPLAVEALIERATRGLQPTIDGKLTAVSSLRDVLNAVPAGLARDLFVDRAAEALGIEKAALQRELRREGARPQRREQETVAAAPATTTERVRMLETQVVRLLTEWPELFESPLAGRLPGLLRSTAARLFVEEGLRQQAEGKRPSASSLEEVARHRDLVKIVAEVGAGRRIFQEEQADAVLSDSCAVLWRHRVKDEVQRLTEELGAAASEERQLELVREKKGLMDQLERGCPWLAGEQGDMEPPGSSEGVASTG